jgi:isopentenyldiphosphate isomerase
MELETAVNVVSRHYSPKLREVVCLHLSDGNSDENEIITRFRSELGITPIIAQRGIVLDLAPNDPF